MLTPKKGITAHVRLMWMCRKRDIPEVLRIERQSFEFPWNEEDFKNYLHQQNSVSIIAEHNKQVVAFMMYELYKKQLHLSSLAVNPDFRRNGIGSQMINELINQLSHQHRNRILLEVREANLSAQLFFHAQEFHAVSILHGFYDDTMEDAYQMQYRFDNPKITRYLPANRISHLLM